MYDLAFIKEFGVEKVFFQAFENRYGKVKTRECRGLYFGDEERELYYVVDDKSKEYFYPDRKSFGDNLFGMCEIQAFEMYLKKINSHKKFWEEQIKLLEESINIKKMQVSQYKAKNGRAERQAEYILRKINVE